MLQLKNKKDKFKKGKSAKDKRAQKKTLESLCRLHQAKGRSDLLYVWQEGQWQWFTRRAFYTEIGRRLESVLPRGQCEITMLQLQYQSLGKPVDLWQEARRGKSKSPVFLKRQDYKVERGRLRFKDRSLQPAIEAVKAKDLPKWIKKWAKNK